MPQMSTAVSDGVLAVATFWTVFNLKGIHTIAAIGFAMMAVAATLGAVKFGSTRPSSLIVEAHQGATWLSTVAGLSLIAIGYHQGNPTKKDIFYYVTMFLMIFATALVVLKPLKVLAKKQQDMVTNVASFVAMLSLLGSSIMIWNPACILAVALYIVAGAIGINGSLLGILKVDWFHYLIAAANIIFVKVFEYNSRLI